MAVSSSAIQTLSAPLAGVLSAAGVGGNGGDLTFINFGSGSGSSSISFWDRFSTWPLFKLSGITGSSVWLVIFSIFFLYVAVIVYVDGGLLYSGIMRSLNIGGCKFGIVIVVVDVSINDNVVVVVFVGCIFRSTKQL